MSNSLDKLESYNINQKDIQKLKDIGIDTIQELYMTRRKNLLNIKGFTERKVKNIFNEANKIETYGLFLNASDFMKERNNNIFKISTSSNSLDDILAGGIESSSITELIGEKNTNKTDFLHILSINAQKSFPESKIIFIDLDNTFNQKKIADFCKELNLKKKKVLENIILINNIEDYEQLLQKLNEISEKMQKGEHCLLIIESLISLFQKIYKDNTLTNSQINQFEIKMDIESKLGQVLRKLKNIAFLFNIAVVITRTINTGDGDNGGEELGNKTDNNNDLILFDPNIDIILGNECVTRIKFKKIKNGKIKCFILNSPILAENNCKFIINEKGIIDC